MAKRAFITGITGQDGSYLSEFLLGKGYDVFGLIRGRETLRSDDLRYLRGPDDRNSPVRLIVGDVLNMNSLCQALRRADPHEVYNLAAQSHVQVSFDAPEFTGEVTGLGTLRLLEAMRETGCRARFYQASTSELFGNAPETPQRETTPFRPRSPYAVAKLYAFWSTVNYRESYDFFACNGVLFNHESPRRPATFVTRKITRAAAAIKLRLQEKLFLGNLDVRRDWGFAGDYVEAMWLMLQQNEPDDYVVATGEAHSVRDFLVEAFSYVDLDWQNHVEIDTRYLRPAEVAALRGDASKARSRLGWSPRINFQDLVRMMVDADLRDLKTGSRID